MVIIIGIIDNNKIDGSNVKNTVWCKSIEPVDFSPKFIAGDILKGTEEIDRGHR